MKTGGGSGGETFNKPETGTVQECVKNEVTIGVGESAVDAHEYASMLISGISLPVPGVRDFCSVLAFVEPS